MIANAVDILLVEDDPDHAELTMRALRGNNLANHVHLARDGAEALEFLRPEDPEPASGSPKLVLLDLKLPKIDGLEVLRRIKASPRTRHIPVVALTSSREEGDLLASHGLGVNSYVLKPIRFEEFQKAVEELGLYWLLLNRTAT